MPSKMITDRRRGSVRGMTLCVGILCPAVLNVGCKAPASDQSPAHQITQVDRVGSISADGRYLSFVKSGEFDELFVRDLVTGEDRRLTGRPDEIGAPGAPISPSGDKIAYSWSGGLVRTVRLDGSETRVLYQNAGVQSNPEDWSANGQEILIKFYDRRDGRTGLGVLSVTTGSLRQVNTTAMLSGDTGSARFSPDGRWIAFDTGVQPPGSANSGIFIVSVDGRLEAPLGAHPTSDRLLDWTPDGQRVFFVSNRAGTWDLWAVRIREGKTAGPPEMIQRDIGPAIDSAGFTTDGSLHYVLNRWENDVYVATIGTSGKLEDSTKVATQLAYDSTVQWSPDGRALVYARAAGDGDWLDPFVLVVRNSETAVESRHLLPLTRMHFFTPNWAPDGRAILSQGFAQVYRGSKLDSQGLYHIDVETGETTPLLQRGLGVSPVRKNALLRDSYVEWPVWSPTGDAIFVRWGNPRRVVARDLQSGTERELYRAVPREEIHHLAVSPDGQRLAVAWWDRSGERAGVKVMSTSGHDVRELLSLPLLADYWLPLFAMAWTPDSRHLIYAPTRRGEKRVELKRVSIDGGPPEDLGLSMEGVWPYGLSVHPDGRRIVFTAGSPLREEVWVLPKVAEATGNAR